ncbi:MAG: hypothetical protein JO033_19300 [Acidobacteriaceae bacterium]|nr:hypothetical protein [Acidobacteriaceae bacterium]MBV9500655.1 hypothetical protein [Acidobacteriaceae bacterium]
MPEPKIGKFSIARVFFALVSAGAVSVPWGCSRQRVSVPVASTTSPADNSYMDLGPGYELKIVTPLPNSPGGRIETAPQQSEGNTVVLSAPNLIGYEVSHYAIEDGRHGKVRLIFASAEMTKNGQTSPEATAPPLPFSLPSGKNFVRLIYLVRVSQSDHNMAITASKSRAALSAFTEELKENPAICEQNGQVFCSWVPAGIAVRPEKVTQAKPAMGEVASSA